MQKLTRGYAPQSIADDELEACICFAIKGQREDGWIPDRIYADGLAVYTAGEIGHPVGEANLDNAPFLVFLVYAWMCRSQATDRTKRFLEWYSALAKGLFILPTKDGLVYSDPKKPHSPYGFTDTVAKAGRLLMESVLLWRSCTMMQQLCERAKVFEKKWLLMAEAIE